MNVVERRSRGSRDQLGQITLLLQGGGALGAYQGGVYEALHERGLEPDWIIGTSIGAINAALIAGNPKEKRIEALTRFWRRVEVRSLPNSWLPLPSAVGNARHAKEAFATWLFGVPGFFEPNLARFSPSGRGTERTALYSAHPLRNTLASLADPARFNASTPRLTIGATNVRTGCMTYFDSRDMQLSLEHVFASSALPPSFPAVEIGSELFWDGGVVSNTPIEAVFDDRARRSGLVFAVHLWNRQGPAPDSLPQAWNRMKEILMSSRTETHIVRQKQLHKLRHIIRELAGRLPKEHRSEATIKDLLSYGCLTRIHVMLLQAPHIEEEAEAKDLDFTDEAIEARWRAGREQTLRLIERAPWLDECDPLEGVILHRVEDAEHVATS